MKNDFQPDYTNLLKVLYNQQPDYLPLYEHNIDEPFIAKMLGREVDSTGKSGADLEEHYRVVTEFWRANTYDALSYEAKICEIYPDHGAILGGRLGPIQTRADFDRYPWEEIPRIFIRAYKPHLDALRKVMPRGMKAYGGCGYGIFESAEDLVGYESLCMMQFLDPDLFRDLFVRIGDLYEVLWTWVLDNYADLFVFCRMGDDPGLPHLHDAGPRHHPRAYPAAAPARNRPGPLAGQEVPAPQLRQHLQHHGGYPGQRNRRQALERGPDRALLGVDRPLRRPHRPVWGPGHERTDHEPLRGGLREGAARRCCAKARSSAARPAAMPSARATPFPTTCRWMAFGP